MYLVNAQQMREIDRFAMRDIGIPGIVLMETAGQAVVRQVEKRWSKAKVVVLSGHGNNGGDGFVAARHLAGKGYPVKAWLIGQPEKMSSDSSIAYHALIGSKYSIKQLADSNWQEFCSDLEQADLIIDGLLGTGIKGELREPMKRVIRLVNERNGASVLAIDIPSGVLSDTGQVIEDAVRADVTVTFAYPKWGHYLFPGAGYCGEIIVCDISIPAWVSEQFKLNASLLTEREMAKLLPKRARHSHKGTYGHVLLIAGSESFVGAPVLAAMGAIRSGSGMVTLAVPKSIQPMVVGQVPEAIYWPWPDREGAFAGQSWKQLMERKGRYDFTVVGPGIGQSAGLEWLENVIRHTEGPLLLDADALNLLAKEPAIIKGRQQVVLTPHPGEMARLIGGTVQDVETNRPYVARQFAMDHQVHVLLKGTYPIIATPQGDLYINPRGSSSLAKGGSGDVLSGMIASFAGQTGSLLKGILLGTYIHGMSGELMDEYSGAASDLGTWIGEAIKNLKAVDA